MICIYHRNCNDGMAAALAVYLYTKEHNIDCNFQTAQYGDSPPSVTGQNVFIVDFSYPRDALLKMHQESASLQVIDHHKSAEQALADLDFCIFDTSKSGAVLTWEYLFPDRPVPELFLYVQDRDLWQWEMPMSKEVSAALHSYKPFFHIWEDFLIEGALEMLKQEGEAITRYQQRHIEKVLYHEPAIITIAGLKIPAINSTVMQSEIGNNLSKDQPFAAVYFDTNDGKRVFSLRSDKNGMDVSEVAKLFGGGGHKHSAGFTIERPKII